MSSQLSSREFRNVMGHFATGVTVVSGRDPEGNPYGLTVNSFTSVSLDPPLVLVCLHRDLSGLDCFRPGAPFAVCVLGQDQGEISNLFATRGTDRASALPATGVSGVPVVDGSLACIECLVEACHDAGDHTIAVGRVTHLELAADADQRAPLLFFRGGYRSLAEDQSA